MKTETRKGSDMSVHIRTWRGSVTATITDMTNAYKRGEKCRVMRFIGVGDVGFTPSQERQDAAVETATIMAELIAMEGVREEIDFNELTSKISAVSDRHPWLDVYFDEINAYYAPRPELVHEAPKWSIRVDNDGISLDDHTDQCNLPAEITVKQSGVTAYKIAQQVWNQVVKADTMYAAARILRDAGARLHYYCRMD